MSTPRRSGSLVAFAVVVVAAYAPYAWLVLAQRPWSEHRLSWIRKWPILPGLFPRAWFLQGVSDLVGTCAMAGFTVLFLGPFVFWAERSRRSLWNATAVLVLLSSLNSWCVYHAFRA